MTWESQTYESCCEAHNGLVSRRRFLWLVEELLGKASEERERMEILGLFGPERCREARCQIERRRSAALRNTVSLVGTVQRQELEYPSRST